jgi:hypothetical protein
MEKLLEQAQQLVKSLQIELSEVKNKNAEANRISAEARIIKGKIEAIKIDLDGREAELAQGEGPVKAAHEARRIQQENAALSTKIEEEKADLERQKKDFRVESSLKKAELNKQAEENEGARINFRDSAAALKKEKDAFSQKLKDLGVK